MAPPSGIYTYHFPPGGELPALKAVWYDGGLMPERPQGLDEEDQLGAGGNGTLFIGDKGLITCPGWAGAPRLLPDSKMEGFNRPPQTLPRSKGHHRDWLDAIKGGPPSSANFEYAARLTVDSLSTLPPPKKNAGTPRSGIPEEFGDNLLSRKLYSHYHRQDSV